MKPLRIAVIGGGHLGKIHAKLLKASDLFEVVGVVDRHAASLDHVRKQLELPAFEDYFPLCSQIDAAVVATPTAVHHPIAIDLLNHGIHTLIEKPVTLSVEEADHLIHLADQQQATLQVGHVERFNPAFESAQASLSGTPMYFEAKRMSGYTFRSTDVGVVLDLMIHDIDLIASMVSSPLIETRATGIAVFGPHEDIAQARLEFANGTVANLTASRCSYEPARCAQWFTETGHVSIDMGQGSGKVISSCQPDVDGSRDVANLNADVQKQVREDLFGSVLPMRELDIQPHNAIEQEHRDFFDSISNERMPRVTGRHGRRALSIAESVVQAIKAHRWTDGNVTRVGAQTERVQLLPNSYLSDKKAG